MRFLRAHYGFDLSAREIARRLGIGSGAVVGKAARLGLVCSEETRIRHCEEGQARRRARPYEAPPPLRGKRPLPRLDRPPLPPPAAPPSDPRPLARLSITACRFPVGGEGADTLFCGERVVPGTSWCPACRARVFLPTPAVDLEALARFIESKDRRVKQVKR